ncbi:hypothetical protein VAE151_550212 [Vibrio aestuarianus]|uniref:Uncharacterized protein n=1 Tax=Vibrio aestuarianus TaxID=28171 RepID=A0ABN8TQU6_9VIBR|nr:hypothetical protein VAE308_1050212 [Vibrio aestuarianus]CAH8193380.1 hypothetical protein VAE055_370212 [Vibrio aestuarianus]CAH8193507.1 hypothetical protein VAE032_270212 [Vibrio aestuarianus]CAH8193583.1 hypothetical protein VAE128_460213 [Vibrio aestuarianus]CAH8193794.1 hypothetical protein VAE130_570213 [Vibrio aestuarianus]
MLLKGRVKHGLQQKALVKLRYCFSWVDIQPIVFLRSIAS